MMVKSRPMFSSFGRLNPIDFLGSSSFGSLNRLLEEVLGNEEGRSFNVDVQNNDGNIIVTADLPGLTKDDLNVSVENGVLTIGGERQSSCKKEENGYCISERSFGKFSRSFRLPDVDESSIDASLKDGVLTILLNKAEDVKPRKIKIN